MLSPHVSRCLAAITLCVAVFLASAAGAAEKDFLPAIVYDFGGKFDRSFNQSASEGAEKFKKDTGIAYREFEITNAAQRDLAMAQLAKRGASIIVAVGFTQASAVEPSSICPTSSRSISANRNRRFSAGWLRRWFQKQVKSASSAAWTFRSSASSPSVTRKACDL